MGLPTETVLSILVSYWSPMREVLAVAEILVTQLLMAIRMTTQNQLPPSDLVLRNFSTRETSLEHIVLDSTPAGTKDPSGIMATVITARAE
jgi:hypothetical protein